MIVRRAREADVTEVALVVAAVAEEDFLGLQPPVDLAARAERYQELLEQEALWVVEDQEKVVGYVAAPETVPGVLSIGMAIAAEARGRGGGRALLDAVKQHARASGAHKISLEVWADNARAIALYASSGFEVEGLRRDHYRRRNGNLRSALIMAWHVEANREDPARAGS